MSATNVTDPQAVRDAIEEYKLNPDGFLARYKRGQAKEYYLRYQGEMYPSKAIIAGAYFHQHGEDIGNFVGGTSVARQLIALGFEVTVRRGGMDVPFDEAEAQVKPTHHAFVVGAEYHRRADIHGVFGGQMQGGISTPAESPLVFLFTGDSGEQYGYHDGWLEDGTTFLYTGEGQRGDLKFEKGNKAIRDHAANGKSLLLFKALGKGKPVRYIGEFACGSWELIDSQDIEGDQRKAIQFHLIRTDSNGVDITEEPGDNDFSSQTIDALRSAAYRASEAGRNSNPREARRIYRQRSAQIKAYVLARSRGRCELTGEPAPFQTKAGQPFLEVHHTQRLSDDGLDDPRWVAAISPNAHREIHYGADGAELNERLKQKIAELEVGTVRASRT